MRSSSRRGTVESPARNVNGSSALGPILCHPSGGCREAARRTISRKEPIMPRLTPVTGKSDVPAEQHAVIDQVVKVFGGVRGPFSMLLHSPKLAERVLGLVTFFRDESVTEPNLRSVAILAAVREREAARLVGAGGRRAAQWSERGHPRPASR